MSQLPVTLYGFSFSHHGKYSSFHRLQNYSKGCRRVDVTFPFRGLFNPVLEAKLEFRWHRLSEWRLRSTFARRERQCVHYLYPENSLFCGADWKGHHGIVLSCHQPAAYLERMKAAGYKEFFRGLECADRVVLLSDRFREGYRTLCDARRTVVIPHGVDIHFFQPPVDQLRKPLVITVGNWLRDYEFWASAVMALGSEMSDAQFAVVASPDVLGAAREQIESALPGRVRFLYGLTDEQLKELYQQASVLLLPLKDAGANNALLEAMACGLPVLVTDLPATREYAGEAGLFFTAGHAEECASKLLRLLSNSGEWKAASLRCRERAVNSFAWEKVTERYAALYSEVLAGR